MKDLKFSIITVVYNSYDYIKNTINSVLGQTYTNFELIVIDGESNDGTLDLIKTYSDSRIKLVSEKDKGIYDAMNKGINVASGDVINFLNSGDSYADVNALKMIANAYLINYSIIACNIFLVDDNFKIINILNQKLQNKIGLLENLCHQSIFYNLKKLKSLIHYDLSLKIVSDFDLLLKIYAFDKNQFLIKVNATLINYLYGGFSEINAITRIKERKKAITNNKEAMSLIGYIINIINCNRQLIQNEFKHYRNR